MALVPGALLGVGALLVVLAAIEGGAQFAVVVVIPVIFGRSWEFAVGVLLLVVGFVTLPLAFEPREAPIPSGPRPPPSASGGSGGLILIGPVPIFFGSWRGVSTRTRVAVAIVGAAILVALLVLVLLVRI
jgi:uncharacterized membrane protein